MNYTDRLEGIQIRDISWLVSPQDSHPLRFDIVKWWTHEPEEQTNLRTGEKKMVTENCYSLGAIGYNRREECFDFKSYGLRWLEAHPSNEVCDMIIDFANRMTKWIHENVDEENGGVVNYGLLPRIHREFSGSPGRDEPDDTNW